jgi:hypothetical protein
MVKVSRDLLENWGFYRHLKILIYNIRQNYHIKSCFLVFMKYRLKWNVFKLIILNKNHLLKILVQVSWDYLKNWGFYKHLKILICNIWIYYYVKSYFIVFVKYQHKWNIWMLIMVNKNLFLNIMIRFFWP